MGNMKFKKNHLWQNGIINFFIDDDALILEEDIKLAVDHWNSCTPIKLINRKNKNDYYLRFKVGNGKRNKASTVGRNRIKKKHTISLKSNASFGTIIHEIGHIVGLHHEHQRKDRDLYVKINRDNIERKGKWYDITNKKGVCHGFYDYDSVMHYRDKAKSENNQKTIEAIYKRTIQDGNPVFIGKRGGLSRGDILTVTFMYDNHKWMQNMIKSGFGGITLYQDSNYNNSYNNILKSYFTLENIGDLSDDGIDMNNKISSLTIHGRVSVKIFSEKDFCGKSLEIHNNRIDDLSNFNVDHDFQWNDKISSIEIIPDII